MRNRQNSYDRTGSSQDFSNNEGFHNYQDYAERSFKNTPHYADRQRDEARQGRQGYRNERSDFRSDYRAGSPGYSQSQNRSEWNRPSLQNSDRYESQGADYGTSSSIRNSQPRTGYAASNTSDASMYGGSDMPRAGGSQYGTGSQYDQTQNWSQGSQTSYPYGQQSLSSTGTQDWGQGSQFGSGSQYGASQQYGMGSQYGAGYGQGSYQSDRFDSRYNANYGYGATSTPRHEYESSRFGQGEQQPSSYSGNFSWQSPDRKTGLHSGKGPKGYRRSDERIREEVSEALSAHGDIDASEIEIEVKEGMVTLTGTVESRQIKRLVEDTVEGISGVQDVKNELRVMTSIENTRSMSSDTTTDGASSRSSSLGKTGSAGRQSSSSQSTSSSKSVQ